MLKEAILAALQLGVVAMDPKSKETTEPRSSCEEGSRSGRPFIVIRVPILVPHMSVFVRRSEVGDQKGTFGSAAKRARALPRVLCSCLYLCH